MGQEEVRRSLTAAGNGCLYIVADFFQLDLVPKKRKTARRRLRK